MGLCVYTLGNEVYSVRKGKRRREIIKLWSWYIGQVVPVDRLLGFVVDLRLWFRVECKWGKVAGMNGDWLVLEVIGGLRIWDLGIRESG